MAEKVITDAITSSRSWRHLSDSARALFPAVLVKTDRWGRRDGDIDKLRIECVPEWPGWNEAKLLAALEQLVREGMIELYLVEGTWYLSVVNHDRYQRAIVRIRRGRSLYPDPAISERSVNDQCSFAGCFPSAHAPARAAVEKQTPEDQELPQVQLPTVEDQKQSADWRLLDGIGRYKALAAQLQGSDETTAVRLFSAAQGLPEGAVHQALESLAARKADRSKRPLESEARYVVAALKAIRDEGAYAQ